MAVIYLNNLDDDTREAFGILNNLSLVNMLNQDYSLQQLYEGFGTDFSVATATNPQSSTFERNWINFDNVRNIEALNRYILTGSVATDGWYLHDNTYYQYKNGRYVRVTNGTYTVYEPLDPDNPDYTVDTLLGSSRMAPAGADRCVAAYHCPTNVPVEMTLNEFRQTASAALIYSRGIDSELGVITSYEGLSGLVGGELDWIYYLVQGTEMDPDPEPPSPEDDPYSPYGPSGPGGGGGNRPPYDEGDDIPYPDDPPVSICDTGLISLYTPSVTQLNLLAADIWSSNFVSSLVKDVYADPIDVIIDVGIVPFNVTPAGTKKIKVGERELDISSNYPQSNYVNFDMGSVALEEALGAYTDFAPYTHGNIYIPFVGFCPLDVDYFMGHNIGLKYKVDLCTGSAVAYLMRDNSVHQQFACNLKIDVPLSGADYSGMWSTIIGATAALATAGAAGLAGATAASEAGGSVAFNDSAALKAGSKSASDIMTGMSTKPQIQKSNSMPNTGGLVGYPYAFIMIEYPALAIPTDQNKFIGYPSYINSKLGSLSGYTRVSSIHLGIPGATKSELLQIEGMLKNGVRIESGVAVTGNGIVLINNSSAENVIGKSMSLVATLTGAFRDEVDIVKPVVRIERASAVGFNYVYISDFGRYYFVEEVKAFRNNILELSLTCDPLESFKTQILNHDAIIDKQENQWNLYLNDDSIKMYQYPLIWRKLFDNAFWDNFEYVLITAGH